MTPIEQASIAYCKRRQPLYEAWRKAVAMRTGALKSLTALCAKEYSVLLIDVNEPAEMVKLLQQSCPVAVSPLNNLHMSDYYFASYDGTRQQFSRKQAGELVGNIDEAEDQLRDYYNQADRNNQVVEGILSPVPIYMKGHAIPVSDHSDSRVSSRELGAKIYCYQVQPSGFIERGHSFTSITMGILYAWVHRLAEAGVTTYWTMNWEETARLLTIIYRNEQKPPDEHHTLQRVIRPRLQVKDADPFMKALLYLSAAYKLDIGEKKAALLFDKYVNLMDLSLAEVDEVAQLIGRKTAEKLLASLGRSI